MSGGVSVSAGAEYQANVTALICAHVLAGSELGWLETGDDTPVAVSPETGGPGDDIGVELADKTSNYLEVQAKHDLTAGGKLTKEVEKIKSRGDGRDTPVVFAVDRAASSTVHKTVRTNLQRLREGRFGALDEETERLAKTFGSLLTRLYIVPVDLDDAAQLETKLALEQLRRVLKDPSRAKEAWAILCREAIGLARRKGRLDRARLIELLGGYGIAVEPLGKNAEWHRRLDFTKRELDRRHLDPVLTELRSIEIAFRTEGAEPRVWYRLYVQRAVALLHQGKYDDALADARRALDRDPTGVHALAVSVQALLALGKVDEARAAANRAVEAYPDDPVAWSAKTSAYVNSDQPPATPPPIVSASAEYRLALAEVAARLSDWERVLELTAQLLKDERREPFALFLRAEALVSTAEGAVDHNERLLDAVRLASEMIEDLDDPANGLTVQGLVVRAIAQYHAGSASACDADLERARALAPDNIEVVRLRAIRREESGDRAGALEVLQNEIVRTSAHLLAMRAEIHARSGNSTAARADLARATELIANSSDPESRVRAASAAVDLEDIERAKEILGDLTLGVVPTGTLEVVLGRIAIAEGRYADASDQFRASIQKRPSARIDLLVLLGNLLSRAGAYREAVAAFDAIGTEIPDTARYVYVRALTSIGDFVRTQALLDVELAKSKPPSWALAHAGAVAWWRDDLDTVVRTFSALDARDDLAVDGRIRLAHALTRAGRVEETKDHLDQLKSDPALTAVQMMETAELLSMADRALEAIPLAFRAARLAPNDPKLQRAFAGLVIRSRTAPPDAANVDADTHVVLRSADGLTRAYTIFAVPPVEPRLGEITLEDARKRGLVGKKVGETVKLADSDAQWKIVEILAALTHAVRQVMSRYHDLFPDQPFFVREYKVSTSGSGDVADFAPIIAELERRKQRVERTFDFYQQQPLPLGSLAKWLGGSIADVMAALRTSPSSRLLVDWGTDEARTASAQAVTTARTLVITRSGLETLFERDLQATFADVFELVAPMSLQEELRAEVAQAEEDVRQGRTTGVSVAGLLQIMELKPDAPELVARRDAIKKIIAWTNARIRFEAPSAKWTPKPGTSAAEVRQDIGASSYDALALAAEPDRALYADDLGLRRLTLEGQASPPPSTSIFGLIDALAERRVITSDAQSKIKVALVLGRYGYLKPSAELLALPIRGRELRENELAALYELLIGAPMTLADGARIGAELVGIIASASIYTVPPATVARRILETLAKRWSAMDCVRLFWRLVGPRLQWNQRELDEVQKACSEFASTVVTVSPRPAKD